MKLTIAIPTFDRLEQLGRAIDAVRRLEIPDGLNLHLAVSNIASRDGTREFLENLQLNKIHLHIYNIPVWQLRDKKDIRSNWLRLAGVVPRDSDWVWLHGDDDEILDPYALHRISDLYKRTEAPRLILFPSAERSTNSEKIYSDSLIDLCQAHGFHEMLGWMSQLVMSGPPFFRAMFDFARFAGESLEGDDPGSDMSVPHRTTEKDPNTAERLTNNHVSSFHHATMILRHFRNLPAVFVDARVIDEQSFIPPGKEDRTTRRAEENVRDRFFYLVDDFIKYLEIPDRALSRNFFRYVNKYLPDLMTSVLVQDLLSPNPSLLLDAHSKFARLCRLRDLMADDGERDRLSVSLELIASAMQGELELEKRIELQALFEDAKRPRLPFKIMDLV